MHKSFFSKRRNVIILTVVLSIILYLAGVISGLYANKIIEQKLSVKLDTEVNTLKNLVDNQALDIKNVLLQQFYIENFNDNSCKFREIYLNHLYSQLNYYWEKLPARLELYEKTTPPSDNYNALKREYIRFLLRVWLIANKNYYECDNKNFLPILYFYTKDCANCVQQGEQFDRFNAMMKQLNTTLIVIPIDGNFNEDTIYLMQQFYNIKSYPAVIVNNTLIQGHVVTAENLKSLTKS